MKDEKGAWTTDSGKGLDSLESSPSGRRYPEKPSQTGFACFLLFDVIRATWREIRASTDLRIPDPVGSADNYIM